MMRSFRRNGRKHYPASTSRERHDPARHSSSDTAIASFARNGEPGAGINSKTVAKWSKRTTVEDLKTGPKAPHSTTLTDAEEAMVVAFPCHTLLPLEAVERQGHLHPHDGRPGDTAAPDRKTIMIDATYLKAHRTASSLRAKKGGRGV